MEGSAYVLNVEGVVVRDGAYLLIERADDDAHAGGLLAFPGGKLEAPPGTDRALEATARRELREEVGVEVGDVTYVHSRTFAAADGTRCIDVVTLCEYDGGEARIREPGEVAAVHWLSPDEVRDRETAPRYLRQDVQRVEDRRGTETG